ncbi:hypothetical protein, partial [Klebsiella aerogenes]|uniref:hypothetical protein n=1 Tax=Klebsiella aerogenes TaxID=548 RepID=UPI001CC3A0A3
SRVRPWSLEELRLAVGEGEGAEGDVREPVLPGQQPPCTVRHPLSLDSAYLAVLGQEPLYTTAHDKYVGTVDYIFYTPQAPGPELAAP